LTGFAERRARPFDLATRGLVNMGFREAAVRRAMDVVSGRHAGDDPPLPVQDILSEALAELT
jgi:hypothetical protein